MAIYNRYTLDEYMKHLAPDESMLRFITETLEREGDSYFLNDIPWQESNGIWGNKINRLAKLPEVSEQRVNQGTPISKMASDEVYDILGRKSTASEMDAKIVEAPGGKQQRLNQDKAHILGMEQSLVETFWYQNEAGIPTGMNSRFHTLNDQTILSAGGSTGQLTSAWIVDFRLNDGVYAIFPKGSNMGIQHFNYENELLRDSDNNEYRGYKSRFEWEYGYVVGNTKAVGRVANIRVDGTTGQTLTPELLKRSLMYMKANLATTKIYMDLEVGMQLWSLVGTSGFGELPVAPGQNNAHALDKGGTVLSFMGYPIRMMNFPLMKNEEKIS